MTPTELFVQVSFTGLTVPYSRIILFDNDEQRIYIKQEVGPDGSFELPFVLDRLADQAKRFSLFTSHKGLDSVGLTFDFQPSTYNSDATKNLLIPPLVDVSPKEIKTNEEVRLIGYACPQCLIRFVLRNLTTEDVLPYEVVTDEYGYAETLIKTGLAAGDYELTATVTRDSIQSVPSAAAKLKVTDAQSMGTGVFSYVPLSGLLGQLGSLLSGNGGTLALLIGSGAVVVFLLSQLVLEVLFITYFIRRRSDAKSQPKESADDASLADYPHRSYLRILLERAKWRLQQRRDKRMHQIIEHSALIPLATGKSPLKVSKPKKINADQIIKPVMDSGHRKIARTHLRIPQDKKEQPWLQHLRARWLK